MHHYRKRFSFWKTLLLSNYFLGFKIQGDDSYFALGLRLTTFLYLPFSGNKVSLLAYYVKTLQFWFAPISKKRGQENSLRLSY